MKMFRTVLLAVMTLTAMHSFVATSHAQKKGKATVAENEAVNSNVIWEECRQKRVFGKTVEACVRIVVDTDDSKFYLEIEIEGKRKRTGIVDGCVESEHVDVGPVEAWAEVCLSDVVFDNGRLKSITVTVSICGEAFGQDGCWKVYEDSIEFLYQRGRSEVPGGYVTGEDNRSSMKR